MNWRLGQLILNVNSRRLHCDAVEAGDSMLLFFLDLNCRSFFKFYKKNFNYTYTSFINHLIDFHPNALIVKW